MHDFGEDGDIEHGLEDEGVGDGGEVAGVCGVVEDNACAGEAAVLDGADGEDGVVEGAEAVVGDDDDGEIEESGEVGHGAAFGERDFPAAGAFDEDAVVLGGEFGPRGEDGGVVEGVVFEEGGGHGREGLAVGDRVDEVEVGAGGAGVEESDGVFTAAAGDWFEADGAGALSGEGAEEEAGDVGFACVGAGAGDEVVHAAGADGVGEAVEN